jgi:undecaprenyl-diphosphatase
VPLLHAILLGITQGLSEFLPISSSGHLRLVPWLFGWTEFQAHPELERTFDVALHLGTLVGALAYFRGDVVRLVRGGLSVLGPRRRIARSAVGSTVEIGSPLAPGPEAPAGDEGRLAWLLLASAVPAAFVGALFADHFDTLARHEWLIGVLLVVAGLVLLWADRLGGRRTADTFSLRDALLVGAAQCLALVPGVSRSGATITAGRALGFDRDGAARLSFLMSLPIIAGALVFEGARLVQDGMPAGFAPAFAWGIVASAVTGYLAVWGTLRWIRTRTFAPFVVYRVVVGVGVVLIAASSLR